MEARDYQHLAARQLLPRAWLSGKKAPLVVAPVGAGKTFMMQMVAKDRFEKGRADFWHLAHRRELIEQPWNLLRSVGLPATRVLAGENPDPTSPLHVASVATLARREIVPCRRQCVISVDEAHRTVSDSYLRLIARFREAYGDENVLLVLWTATPYRLDGRSLGDVADEIIEVVTPEQLFANGVLMEPKVLGADDPDLSGVARRGGDFVPEALAERMDNQKLVGNTVDQWIKHSGGAPSVYFACSIAHSQHLVERFQAAGVRAAHLDGETPLAERSRILARLAIGGRGSDHPEALDVIVNVDVLREGWDSASDYQRVLDDKALWRGHSYPPEYQPLEVLGDCAPTESCCAYRQREGRVCRSHPRKRRAVLISHSGNWKRHGFLRDHHSFTLDPRRRATDSLERKARVAVFQARHCPSCLSVWPGGMLRCPCGEFLGEPPRMPEEDEQQLTEVKQVKIPPPNPQAEFSYLRAVWAKWMRDNFTRKANGKPPAKDGQVRVLFFRKFGRWPAQQMLIDARRAAEGKSDA